MTSSNYRKNLLFAKYGHECEMANELDELPTIIPGDNLLARIRRALVRLRIVSETSKRSSRFLRSQGAIANEKHIHLTLHPYMIHPFSDIRKWWEFFMCIVFLVQFLMIPLDVAYFYIPTVTLYRTKTWKWTRMIFDSFCFFDVWLNFVTGYYNCNKKQTILSPTMVAIHYAETYFFPDFLSSIPTHFDLFFDIDTNSVVFLTLQFASILKILRLVTFTRYCNDIGETYEIPYPVHKIALVLIISFIYFHLISCAMVLSYGINVGYLSSVFNVNTTKVVLSESSSLLNNGSYAGAFYKAVMIISTAGYGKKAPGQPYETLLIISIWLISRILLVFVFGRIMQVIKATTSASHKYIEMERQLREYMRYRQLPDHMQRRLTIYYEFRFQKSYFRESEILSTISGQLRQEIVMHSCRKLVENVAFFKNLPLTLLVRIVSCLRSEVFLVNDVIVRAATPGNSMFFIASGTVAVFTSSGREICHLEDGAHFGEIALVMKDELRVASVVAVEVCELYSLDRKEFVRAIHPYPDLLDNIQRIAADRMERTTMLDEHNRREMASRRLY